MKLLQSFLKGISIICLSFFLSFFDCSKDVDVQTTEMQPLTDVCTLELTFGDEKTVVKDEFLLAQPIYIDVNNAGDIFIPDENRIKVFDKNGKEKRIIGGPGYGPGEFGSNMLFHTLSYSGYLTVTDLGGRPGYFSIFLHDLEFKEKVNFNNSSYNYFLNNNNYVVRRLYTVYTIDNKSSIVHLSAYEIEENTGGLYKGYELLIYENPDTILTIAKYPFNNIRICYNILYDNRILFTKPDIDQLLVNDTASYSLHIVSLDSLNETRIIHKYVPVERQNPRPNDTKYYPPVKYLTADRNFLFVYTYQRNEKREWLVDIFDLEEERYIHSAYFPLILYTIRNEYGYRINTRPDDVEMRKEILEKALFPLVEKYKIDPAVYGK